MIHLKNFIALVDEFLLYLIEQKKISAHTKRAYKADLIQFHTYWLTAYDEKKIRRLTFNEVLQQHVTRLHQEAIEKRSVARKLSTFSSFIKFLSTRGHEITIEIKRPTFERKLPRALQPDEVCALLDLHPEALPSLSAYRDKAILEILYATGITPSELVVISIHDVDIENRIIKVIGKKNKIRFVFFGSKAQKNLLAYVTHERPPAQSKYEALFLNNQKKPLTTRSIQKICNMFKQFLPDDVELTPHTLRHSFATHLLENGTNKNDLKELLGYQTLLSTEQYAHVIPKLSKQIDF